jgi:hypothetical protein
MNLCLTIRVEIYNSWLYVCFGDIALLMKELKRYKHISKERKEQFAEFTKTRAGSTAWFEQIACIWLQTIPTESLGMSCLQHELYHVTGDILRNAGIEHTAETEECYAYLNGYLTKKVLQKLEDTKKWRIVHE